MNHFPEVSSENCFGDIDSSRFYRSGATTMSIDTAEFAQQLSATVA